MALVPGILGYIAYKTDVRLPICVKSFTFHPPFLSLLFSVSLTAKMSYYLDVCGSNLIRDTCYTGKVWYEREAARRHHLRVVAELRHENDRRFSPTILLRGLSSGLRIWDHICLEARYENWSTLLTMWAHKERFHTFALLLAISQIHNCIYRKTFLRQWSCSAVSQDLPY